MNNETYQERAIQRFAAFIQSIVNDDGLWEYDDGTPMNEHAALFVENIQTLYMVKDAELAALRAELDALQARCDEKEHDAGYWHYRALRTEAELEAQLAAQQWRPVTEKPAEPPDGETSEYLTWNELVGFTVRCYRDGQFHSAFRNQPTHYRPLPPAPDEADEVQP